MHATNVKLIENGRRIEIFWAATTLAQQDRTHIARSVGVLDRAVVNMKKSLLILPVYRTQTAYFPLPEACQKRLCRRLFTDTTKRYFTYSFTPMKPSMFCCCTGGGPTGVQGKCCLVIFHPSKAPERSLCFPS
jgi:hypothetical protein